MPNAVFRFDASSRIGSGHGVRCLALARKLARNGWRVSVASSAESYETVSVPAELRRIVLGGSAQDEEERIGAAAGPADLLVIDHYGRDACFETGCRAWARKILVVDDLADRPHDCDFLLDQTLGRQEADYRPLVPAHCRLLLGPKFALLRDDFAVLRSKGLLRRKERRMERVLVSMGGTDPNEVSLKAVEGILDSGLPVAVDLVLGATAVTQALASAVERSGGRVSLLSHVENMAELMAEADLAIGAGGVTSWERCCMGLPALIVLTADNQELVAARLAELGAARVLGWHAEVGREKVAAALCEIHDDLGTLTRMSQTARDLCDGKGGARAIVALEGSEPDREGRSVSLRLAEPEDTWEMYSWQSHPGVRRYMLNPEIPTKAEHQAWMENRLNNLRGWFCVIDVGGLPAGVVRFDEDEGDPQRYVVAILVAPDQVQKGVGAAALRIAGRLLPGAHLLARVASENSASRRLFSSVGYVVESDHLFHRYPEKADD